MTIVDIHETKAHFVSRASLRERAIEIGVGKLDIGLQPFIEYSQADGYTWMGIDNRHLLDRPWKNDCGGPSAALRPRSHLAACA